LRQTVQSPRPLAWLQAQLLDQQRQIDAEFLRCFDAATRRRIPKPGFGQSEFFGR